MVTPEQHANKIRDALAWAKARSITGTHKYRMLREATEAVDALVAQAQEAATLRGTLADEMGLTEQQRARAEAAEQRASQLEHERDKALSDAAHLRDEGDVFLRNVRRLEHELGQARVLAGTQEKWAIEPLLAQVSQLEHERDEWRRQERLAVHDAERLERELDTARLSRLTTEGVAKTHRRNAGKARREADQLRAALEPIVKEYDLWSEDANDGEFRLWDLDRLVMAIVNARAALAGVQNKELPTHCVATSDRIIAKDGKPFACAVCDNILVRENGVLSVVQAKEQT